MVQIIMSVLFLIVGLLEIFFCNKILSFLIQFSISGKAKIKKGSFSPNVLIIVAQGALFVYMGVIGIIYYVKNFSKI